MPRCQGAHTPNSCRSPKQPPRSSPTPRTASPGCCKPPTTRALICADPNVPGQAGSALAAAELARQQAALHERRTALTAVIGEAALHQQAGSPRVTSAQFRYLAEMGGKCPHVCIRILPFTAGEHASSGAGYSVLQFSQVPWSGLVHIDGPGDGICTDTPAAVAACATTFQDMQKFSLTTEESAARLGKQSRVREA